VGVFLAEGGSRELGSAMPIALAKGYLLYASGWDLAPAEILRRLYETMDAALQGEASISVLYAVIDARARTLRFARTGVSPRLSINGNPAAEEVAFDPADAKAIRHGAATLARGDAIFFYTDGLAAQLAERKRQFADAFLQKLVSRETAASASDLQSAIVKAAIRGKQLPPDDVTSVVIRVEEPAAQAMGVVA
jgi:serine phosphatase RsbU (regulator of sigma subunit)